MNQLFLLLEKEIGNVMLYSLRHVPVPKDGDGQDALEMFEEEARRRGIMFVDDSPENLKSPSSFNQFKNADLTRTNEIQSRYNLAIQLKNEAWELVGITRQRLGSTAGATETATATQSGLSQSYAQTEPYFAKHEYVLNSVYQAMLDAAQYVEKKKPESTISYIGSDGEQAFIRVNSEDISFKDLKVFITSRAEDQKVFEKLQELAQAMLQNGADPYDVTVLYTENSIRQMKQIFKNLKEKKEEMIQQQQQMEQQQIEQQQQAVQAQIEADHQEAELNRQNENYNEAQNRISKEKIAVINSFSKQEDNEKDVDQNGVPDVLEVSRLTLEQQQVRSDKSIREKELNQRQFESLAKLDADRGKQKIELEKSKNDLKMQQLKLKEAKAKAAAAKNKPKPKSKSK